MNTAPPPEALAAVTAPSCSAATATTMARPRPAPGAGAGRVLLPKPVKDVVQRLGVEAGAVVSHG